MSRNNKITTPINSIIIKRNFNVCTAKSNVSVKIRKWETTALVLNWYPNSKIFDVKLARFYSALKRQLPLRLIISGKFQNERAAQKLPPVKTGKINIQNCTEDMNNKWVKIKGTKYLFYSVNRRRHQLQNKSWTLWERHAKFKMKMIMTIYMYKEKKLQKIDPLILWKQKQIISQ